MLRVFSLPILNQLINEMIFKLLLCQRLRVLNSVPNYVMVKLAVDRFNQLSIFQDLHWIPTIWKIF
jgi:hypothetical protein